MKNYLIASAVVLLFFAQAKAEIIIIDGVVDETPNQSYRAAGGGLHVYLDNGPYSTIGIAGRIFADRTKYPKAHRDFGEDVKFQFCVHDQKNPEGLRCIDPTSEQLRIGVRFVGNAKVDSPHLCKEITRDPNNPLDYTFRVVVTEYTPGAEGELGTAKVELSLVETGTAVK